MFTGLVEEVGRVLTNQRSGDGWSLSIQARTVLDDVKLGDSINVDGVCLSVAEMSADTLTFGLAPETRSRTTLEPLKSGDRVNLERAVRADTRLGGHFVQGHVDGVGTIKGWERDEDALWLTVEPPPPLLRYVAMKGYVALNGTSLTVARLDERSFAVTLVAYTQDHVALTDKAVGEGLNIEVDILAKYVERAALPFLKRSPGEHALGER